MERERKNILVISVMGVGNALLGLPLVRALSRQKSIKVDVAAWPPVTARLLENNPFVGTVIPVESNSVPGLLRAALECRALRPGESYELFPPSDRGHLLSLLCGAGRRAGFAKPGGQNWTLNARLEVREGLHDIRQNLRLAGSGEEPRESEPLIYLTSPEMKQAATQIPGPGCIGFHIGSGATLTGRRWPAASFAALMDGFHQAGHRQLMMVGGPSQQEQMEQCRSMCRSAAPFIAASPDIRREAALTGRCRLFISNDALWLHIAAALRVPTIGIYGPTDPARTAPLGPNHRIVKTDLICAPCYTYERWKECPRNYQCLKNIRPEQIMEQAVQMLG